MFKKRNIIFIAIIITVLFSLNISAESDYHLRLTEGSGEVLMNIPVKVGSEFIVTFIHSSELEPWDDLFEVSEDGEMILREIRVPSTGPGVPSVLPDDWEFEIKDGYFIYDSVDIKYKTLDYIVSSISPHYLIINDEKINLVELSENWAKIKFELSK
ncbi:hypothetical protein DFR78_10866 [Halanaerobium sp. MA284_MarDTE_T2]|nr:hypothetical protein DFR78_10866 [Halanaerobium sp. MA284_MarDTE_T2]RCW86573.1 hypothetical protein DER71_10836 [Halanaerobium sp. DL-01]